MKDLDEWYKEYRKYEELLENCNDSDFAFNYAKKAYANEQIKQRLSML